MKPKISEVLDAAADSCMARYQRDDMVTADPVAAFGREFVESRRLADMLRSMAVVFRSAGE
jgi:hypothetical protein